MFVGQGDSHRTPVRIAFVHDYAMKKVRNKSCTMTADESKMYAEWLLKVANLIVQA